jgi:hypothetical protein
MSALDLLGGMVLGAILAGTLAGVCGHVAGLETGREQGITIGESRANMACDKAHYEVCKLVRTFTPKTSPSVECYSCPGATNEECLVPSWKAGVPQSKRPAASTPRG